MAQPPAARRRASAAPPELIAGALPEIADPQVAALDRQTTAIEALADEIRLARQELKPGIEAIDALAQAQAAFCGWIKRKGPWFLASAPGVLVAIGAIQPKAAEAFGRLIHALTGG